MTTLPQNSPLRLPSSVRGPAQGGSAATVPTGMTGGDVIRVLRANSLLIVLMLLVSSVAGYLINDYLRKNLPKFTSLGYLEIQQAPGSPLREVRNDPNILLADQRTQVQLMKTDGLLGEVLQKSDTKISETSWYKSFKTPQDRKDALRAMFSVSAIPETRLILASVQWSVPEEARVICQEVVDAHLNKQSGLAVDRQYTRTTTLQNMRTRVQTDLRNAELDRALKTRQLTENGMAPGARSYPTKETELQAALEEQIRLQSFNGQAKSQLAQLEDGAKNGFDPAFVVKVVEADNQYLTILNQIQQTDTAIASLTRTMGPASPRIKNLQEQRDGYQARLDEVRKDMLAKKRVQLGDELRESVRSTDAGLENQKKLVDSLKTQLAELQNLYAQWELSQQRETLLRDQLKEINANLDDASVANGGGTQTTINWVQTPNLPDSPSFPKLKVTMTVAIMMGLAFALGLAFLRELMDTTVRSPRDIAKVGSMNVLGQVPHEDDDPQAAGARLPLVIFEAPNSMTAEQFRQVRTQLQHAASLDTMRSLMVTSANPGDGKTTVAVNLAAGLALIGRKILLVDANFRRPELHKVFALDNAEGFGTVLNNRESFGSAVKESPVPNLSVLSNGPKPANATELLESQLLADFIERALEEYDHVVFDTGPLLFASETVAMAPRVDGVVTVVKAGSNTRGVLSRMKESLRQLRAEHLGIVLNAVRGHGGGYYRRNIKTYYEYANNPVG